MSAADRTKRMIASELKKLCKTIPLRKITVKTIVESCEINRGTFYYHFTDKQDLINYVYHEDVTVPLRILFNRGVEKWNDLTLNSLRFMYDAKEFYMQAFQITGQNDIQSFILQEVKENWRIITRKYVEYYHGDVNTNYRYMYYISDYLATGAVSMMVNWVLSGMKEPPEEIAMLLDLGSNYGLMKALDYIVGLSK